MKYNDFQGLIFLDVDGVLNHENYYRQFYEGEKKEEWLNIKHSVKTHEDFVQYKMRNLCPDSCAQVERIVTTCDLGIVFSSSWRGVDWAEEGLRRKIPSWERRYCGRTAKLAHVKRGIEIQDWLTKADYRKKFGILDDDGDMVHLMPYLFQTNTEAGLSELVANSVIAYFQS